MNEPKLHHFVPQFHLRRFADAEGKFWVWDRKIDRIFRTSPRTIAAETQFYRLTQYEELGYDGAEMERQLADIEGEVATITGQWLGWLRQMELQEKVPIPSVNREMVSLHIALQYLRTSNVRDLLCAFTKDSGVELSNDEQRRLHTELMWDEDLFTGLAKRFEDAVWTFARNVSAAPLITSDNPVAFRTADNRMWLRTGISTPGTYVVFPLAPDIVMYCYPREKRFVNKLDCLADCLSPVQLDAEMVESENSGQVFMATRFVISNRADFDAERAFAATIGTDAFAPKA